MITVWRIVKARYADQAFSGEGARQYGGRWNSPGTRVVYCSGSISLCTLEMLVHLQQTSVLSSYVLFRVEVDEADVAHLDRTLLPASWREYPAPPELALLGEAWLSERQTPVLDVPSAVVESESNYLLNPAHPRFSALRVDGPFDYHLDSRLIRPSG